MTYWIDIVIFCLNDKLFYVCEVTNEQLAREIARVDSDIAIVRQTASNASDEGYNLQKKHWRSFAIFEFIVDVYFFFYFIHCASGRIARVEEFLEMIRTRFSDFHTLMTYVQI